MLVWKSLIVSVSGVRLLRKIFHHGFHPQWGVLLSPEKQPVVIEALSLLRMATGNEAIDFSRGGETLHAIYAIERILAKYGFSAIQFRYL